MKDNTKEFMGVIEHIIQTLMRYERDNEQKIESLFAGFSQGPPDELFSDTLLDLVFQLLGVPEDNTLEFNQYETQGYPPEAFCRDYLETCFLRESPTARHFIKECSDQTDMYHAELKKADETAKAPA